MTVASDCFACLAEGNATLCVEAREGGFLGTCINPLIDACEGSVMDLAEGSCGQFDISIAAVVVVGAIMPTLLAAQFNHGNTKLVKRVMHTLFVIFFATIRFTYSVVSSTIRSGEHFNIEVDTHATGYMIFNCIMQTCFASLATSPTHRARSIAFWACAVTIIACAITFGVQVVKTTDDIGKIAAHARFTTFSLGLALGWINVFFGLLVHAITLRFKF